MYFTVSQRALRTFVVRLFLGLCLVAAAEPIQAREKTVIDLGGETFLFIDEWGIDRLEGAQLTVHPPRVGGTVFRNEKPWEQIEAYTTVIDDGSGLYKLYYLNNITGPLTIQRADEELLVREDGGDVWQYCVATSRDGVHWERPNLGRIEWDGSKANNICFQYMHGGSAFYDPHDPDPSKRYKFFCAPRGYPRPLSLPAYLYTSADGLHWSEGTPVMRFIIDSQPVLQFDHNIGKYVAYLRSHLGGRHVVRAVTEAPSKPWPYKSNRNPTRADLIREEAIFPGQEYPVVMAADATDPPLTDIYNSQVFIYPWAHRVYLAFPTVFYKHAGPRAFLSQGLPGAGAGEVQLAVSRDGINWKRYRRPAYLKSGRYQDRYSYWSWIFQGMIRRPDRIYQYGILRPYGHSETQFVDDAIDTVTPKDPAKRDFILLEQGVDRFVAVRFDYTGGRLLTDPIIFQGNRLILNVNTSAAGHGRVGIVQADASPLPGFTADECELINGDWLAKTVAWSSTADVGSLAGQTVRLEFRLRGSDLFGFRFVTK